MLQDCDTGFCQLTLCGINLCAMFDKTIEKKHVGRQLVAPSSGPQLGYPPSTHAYTPNRMWPLK